MFYIQALFIFFKNNIHFFVYYYEQNRTKNRAEKPIILIGALLFPLGVKCFFVPDLSIAFCKNRSIHKDLQDFENILPCGS